MILERDARLSTSRLWPLMRRWFEARGLAAWSRREVPHWGTCNAFVAAAYARVIEGFLRDRAARGQLERVDVVELGAGSGRLGLAIVVELAELRAASPTPLPPARYVLTDVAERTLAAWRSHPRLAPHLASGALDLARLDLEAPFTELRLESGERLDGGPCLVAVANYVFDSLPQELVRRGAGGRLEEGRVTLRVPDDDGLDLEDPVLLELVQVELGWTVASDRSGGTDPDAELAALAESEALRAGPAGGFFPVGGLRCLRRLLGLTDDLLLLATDRVARPSTSPLDGLARHGSVSLPVSLEALSDLVRRRGGATVTRDPGAGPLWSAALLSRPAEHPEAARAFRAALDPFGPGEVLALKQLVEARRDELSPEELAAAVRLTRFDPAVLALCAGPLAARPLEPRLRRELRGAVAAARARFLPLEPDGEVDELEAALAPLLPLLAMEG